MDTPFIYFRKETKILNPSGCKIVIFRAVQMGLIFTGIGICRPAVIREPRLEKHRTVFEN